MSPALLVVTAGYLALVGVLALLAALGVRCRPAVETGVVVAEIALIAQVLVDLFGLARGHRPAEPIVHLGYVLVSVALLPLLLGRRGGRVLVGSGASERSGLRRRGAGLRRRRGRRRADARDVAVSRAHPDRRLHRARHRRGRARAVQLGTRAGDAPVPYALSALAALVYLTLAVALRRDGRWRQVAFVAATAELIGVLAVGTAEQLSSTAWPDETVWSGFGAGYGWAPLVLPVAALVVLWRNRAGYRAQEQPAC